MDLHAEPLKCPRHGRTLRKMIAAGIRISGGDVIKSAGKFPRMGVPGNWRPPQGWLFEKIELPAGATAYYLVPPDCARTDAVILEIHGGGYTIGYMTFFIRRAVQLALLGGRVPVLSLNYRVAPANPYPAALDDVMDAVDWLGREKKIPPESILTIGESAGGGLALALAMKLRDTRGRSLRALVLMSPWTNLTCTGDSYKNRYAMDPVFGRGNEAPPDRPTITFNLMYAGGHDLKDPYISPSFGTFTGMPPMLVHAGECEMLYDDAVTVHEKAVAAGVASHLKIWPGMFHTFQVGYPWLKDAREAWAEISAYIKNQLGIDPVTL